MNFGPPATLRPTLATRARNLTERAGAILAGVFPAAGASGEPASAPVSPRHLTRALSRRTRARALARLHRLPCFDAADYLALNPDVDAAGFDPAFHALFIGAIEGRKLFRRQRLAQALGAAACAGPNRFQDRAGQVRREPVGVFVNSQGNVFMHDIARDIADSLGAAGVPVTLRDETAPGARRPPRCLFVAPHEFFLLGKGRDWIADEVIAQAVMLNTEQPQTSWFASALPFLLAAGGVIDLSAQHTSLFAAAGVPALHITPAPAASFPRLGAAVRQHDLFKALPSEAQLPADPATPFDRRPIDIAFFGGATPQRDAWFAHNAGFLADFETFLYHRSAKRGPIRAESADGALSDLASHVSGHAKIALNLHRDEFGYFEWHRIVRLGMAAGSVVVSEPCPPHPVLLPGVHYFEAPARQIPDMLEWLLRSPDGNARAAEVRDCAADFLAVARRTSPLPAFLHEIAQAP